MAHVELLHARQGAHGLHGLAKIVTTCVQVRFTATSQPPIYAATTWITRTAANSHMLSVHARTMYEGYINRTCTSDVPRGSVRPRHCLLNYHCSGDDPRGGPAGNDPAASSWRLPPSHTYTAAHSRPHHTHCDAHVTVVQQLSPKRLCLTDAVTSCTILQLQQPAAMPPCCISRYMITAISEPIHYQVASTPPPPCHLHTHTYNPFKRCWRL